MQKKSRKRVVVGLAAGTSAVAVIGGSVALADIPDGATINACRNAKSGALRAIDKSKGGKCAATEKPLSWSKTGAKGAKGATGAPGAPGAPGATGPSGVVGSAYASSTVGLETTADALDTLASGFTDPQVTVTSGQTVEVTSTAVLGSTTGGSALSLSICYAVAGS